ncbi:MAG: NAD-glutamate dehydrogenase, partial [Alphaproteobacteria bacterium]|nr:NAD-glutamate dehydrogenase [Alphaproteobacteria bacterium]
MTKRALPGETQGLDRVALDNVCTFCAGAMTKRAEKSPEIRIELLRSDTERRMLRVAVVNDDMPFLVDSITGVLAAHGIEVDRLLHPVLHVSRDESGSLIKLADQPFGSKSMAESLVYIEIERVDARERAALIRDLGQALAHVRAAVKDWSALRNVMENEMRKTPDEEAAHLLGWFLENKFTLLGACTYQRNGRIVQRHGVGRLIADKLLAPASRERAFAWFEETGAPLLAIKANILSSVHRRAPFDLILLPKRQGNTVVGLSVHAGLWTSAALATTPALVPVVRKFFVELREKLHFSPTSHT